MHAILGKIRLADLRQFLLAEHCLWMVDGSPGFEEFVARFPLSTEELLTAIVSYAGSMGELLEEDDFVYLFGDTAPADETAKLFSLDEAKLQTVKSAANFVIRGSIGKDFLYICCTKVGFSNGSHFTLLRHADEI